MSRQSNAPLERLVPRLQSEVSEGGMTKSEFKADCDVNLIMKKYVRDGVLKHVGNLDAIYGDFDYMSYHDVMNQALAAEQAFLDLPAKARKYFGNDPATFLEYMNDNPDSNLLSELGLTNRWAEPDPEPVEPKPEAASGES